MVRLFRALFARIRALFAADAALELQAEIAVRGAERKAQLYRLAAKYDEEGFASIAHDLRRQAEALHLQQSVGDVIPPIDELINDNSLDALPGCPIAVAAPVEANAPANGLTAPVETNSKVSGRVRPQKR